jgi:dTDP-4-amino-4,6-dideoxygalactose transaminase
MCPEKLENWLKRNTFQKNKKCINKNSSNIVSTCLPMHTFGNPIEIDKISSVCRKYNINLIEDCAESLGSFYKKKHTGTIGKIGTFSFNGNKIITSGGGGAIITNNKKIAKKIKHLSTTAKLKHPWEFIHDKIGFNYRMPNLNAALGYSQMKKMKKFLADKKKTSHLYKNFFSNVQGVNFFESTPESNPNHWLNLIFFSSKEKRDLFLKKSNENKVNCRAIWKLMPDLNLYKEHEDLDIPNAKKIYNSAVLLPSSTRQRQ